VNLAFTDTLPSDVAYVSCSGSIGCGFDGTKVSWPVGSLSPGGNLVLEAVGRVGLVCAPTALSNSIYFTGQTDCGPIATMTNPVMGVVQPPATTVAILKTQTPANPGIGAGVTYRIVVANTGTATIDTVFVADTISPVVTLSASDEPAGFAAPTVTSVVGTGTRYDWSATGLTFLPGATYTFTITGTVGDVGVPTGVSNTALVTGSSACTSVSATDDAAGFVVSADVILAANFAIYGNTFSVGQDFIMTMTVTNTGTTPASNVSATMWKSSAGPGTATSGASYPVNVAALAADANVTFTWTLTAAVAGAPIQWTGRSRADGPVFSTFAASPQVSIQTPANLVTTVTMSPNTVCAGQNFNVQVEVANTGQATADMLNIEPIYEDGPGAPNGLFSSPVLPASMPGNTSATYVWTYTAGVPLGIATYSTTATGDDINSGTPISSTVSSAAVTESAGPVLEAIMATTKGVISTGQGVQVHLTVTNTGGTNATALTATLFYGAEASLAAGPVPALVGTLTPGANTTFTWWLAGAASGTLGLTGTVSGSGCSGVVTDASSGAVTVQTAASLDGVVHVDYLTRMAGELVVATITVTNTGEATANGVWPNSMVPAGVTGQLSSPSPASVLALASGVAQTFVWSFTTTGGGILSFTGNVVGTDANSGAVVSTGAQVSPAVTVLLAANITASLVMSTNRAMIGDTVGAALSLRNIGGDTATVYVSYVEAKTPAATIGAAAPASPLPLVVLAPGASWSGGWSYVAGACGNATIGVTVSSTAWYTGLNTASVLSRALTVRGVPVLLAVNQSDTRGRVGGIVDVDIAVVDSCGNAADGIPVNLTINTGNGFVTPGAPWVTDANGLLRIVYHLDNVPGYNNLLVTVPGTTLFENVTALGSTPDKPTPFLTTNMFDPTKGESVQVRLMVPVPLNVSVQIYNLAGELVRKLSDQPIGAGLTAWRWDGRNASGDMCANGSYFIQIISGKETEIKRVIILKK
jgi:uncharacterized repeat protein (TIGR01451 family)